MTGPLVSVCVPTFNRASYIREALESVLSQTYSNLEVVVCDNASQDGTAEIVAALSDRRIRYLRNDRNLGLAANWIKAVSAATGRYCAIIGDDDRWAPAFIESLVPALEADPTLDVAFCDHWVIDDAGQTLVPETEACTRAYRASLRAGRHRPFLELAVADQAIPVAAALIRRDRLLALGALDHRAGLVLDYYLFARLSLGGGGAFYWPGRLASVRRHAAAGSQARFAEIWPDMQWVCADLFPDVQDARARQGMRKKWAHAIVWQLAALAGRRAWGELPPAISTAASRIPAGARLQLGIMTALAALSFGLDRAWHPARAGGLT
jgi:glycosyltransferase involved in cell wall biosynthesis